MRESPTGGISWAEAEADGAKARPTESEDSEDRQRGGGEGSDEPSEAPTEYESQTGRPSQQSPSLPVDGANNLDEPTGSYLRSRVANLSVDSCPGCAAKSEERTGATPTSWLAMA